MKTNLFCALCVVFAMAVSVACSVNSEKLYKPHSILEDKAPSTPLVTKLERLRDPYLWCATYYQYNDYENVPSTLEYINRIGDFRREGVQDYVTAFLAYVFRMNPDKTDYIAERCRSFASERGATILATALWLARTDSAAQQFRSMARESSEYGHMLGTTPTPVVPRVIKDITGVNAALGAFHATGDAQYLDLLINCLDETQYNKNEELKRVSQVTKVMLPHFASQDPVMFDYCKKRNQNPPSGIAYDLATVIRHTESQIRRAQDERVETEIENRTSTPNVIDMSTEYQARPIKRVDR